MTSKSEFRKELKSEGRELKHMFSSGKAQLSGQNTRTAVLKATSTDPGPPKKKHVQYLLGYTHSGENPEKVYSALQERTKEKNWIVAYKALAVFHTLMKDGDRRFMKLLSTRPTNFGHMHSYLDRLNMEGFAMSTFIRKHAAYLEEKIATFRELRMDFVRDAAKSNEHFGAMTNSELVNNVKVLEQQMQFLLDTEMTAKDMTNGTIKFAYLLLMRDCIKLYVSLNNGIIMILDRYFKMALADARIACQCYEKFVEQTKKITDFLSVGREVDHSSVSEVPNLKPPPASLVTALRDYIKGLEGQAVDSNKQAAARKEIETFSLAGPQATELARTVLAAGSSRGSLESEYGLAGPPSRRLSGTASGGLRSRGNSTGGLAQEMNLISLDDDPVPTNNPMAVQPYGMHQQQPVGPSSFDPFGSVAPQPTYGGFNPTTSYSNAWGAPQPYGPPAGLGATQSMRIQSPPASYGMPNYSFGGAPVQPGSATPPLPPSNPFLESASSQQFGAFYSSNTSTMQPTSSTPPPQQPFMAQNPFASNAGTTHQAASSNNPFL